MQVFVYRARNEKGELLAGRMESDNVKTAASKLQSSGLYPVSIKPYNEKGNGPGLIPFGMNQVTGKDIVIFTRRLSDLLRGGLSLAKALNILARQTENKELKKNIGEIYSSIQEGQAFSRVLGRYPKLFSDLYVGVIQTGESTGLLESVLSDLAEFNEKEQDIRDRIKTALAYPAVMITVGLISIIFLLVFVFPRFELMFRDMGQMLPMPTRILLFISRFLEKGWWLYLPVLIVSAVALSLFSKSKQGIAALSRLKFKIPLLGSLIKKETVSRFARMFGTLTKNNVPIFESLKMLQKSIGNHFVAKEIELMHRDVMEGKSLVNALNKSCFFPPLLADMVSVGEETGNIGEALLHVAETYEREVGYSIKALISVLEPVIILLIGIVVAFIAISMLLPVFQVSSIIR